MKTLLWIDDDEALLDDSAALFKRNGFTILKALTPSAALKALREHKKKLDGILLDVRLGGGEDGIRLLKELRHVYKQLRVVVFTAYADYLGQVDARSAGALAYFEKLDKSIPLAPEKQKQFFAALHSAFPSTSFSRASGFDAEHHRASMQRSRFRILFLAADPSNASRLRVGEELREIKEKLRLARLRSRFSLEACTGVRPADITQALLDFRPDLVHFAGHGASSGSLCLENKIGKTKLIKPAAIAALFKEFSEKISCVLLNACCSDKQARALSSHIPFAIGMNGTVDDGAAIAFALGFYHALGAGCSIPKAVELGRVQIRLQDAYGHLTPILYEKPPPSREQRSQINKPAPEFGCGNIRSPN